VSFSVSNIRNNTIRRSVLVPCAIVCVPVLLVLEIAIQMQESIPEIYYGMRETFKGIGRAWRSRT